MHASLLLLPGIVSAAVALAPMGPLPTPKGPLPGPAPTSKVKPKKRMTAKTTHKASSPHLPRAANHAKGNATRTRITTEAEVDGQSLLSQFRFKFLANDRHLRTVGVLTHPGGRITTSFGDQKYDGEHQSSGFVFDNPYPDFFKRGSDAWYFDHAFVQLKEAVEVGERRNLRCAGGGKCRFEIPVRPGTIFVLRGFEFTFDKGDRHIKTIKLVGSSDGWIEAEFGDKTPDDGYRVSVQYAYLPRAWAGDRSDDAKRGWTETQQGEHAVFDLRDDVPNNLAISGFEFTHPDAANAASRLADNHTHGEVDQDDGHVREFFVRPWVTHDRRVEAVLTDDANPDHTVRLWMQRIAPQYLE